MFILGEVLTNILMFPVIIILVACFLYYHGTKTFGHFERLGVKVIKPVPYFGNSIKSTLNQRNIVLCHKEVYDKTKDEDFVGFFHNRTPFLMIRNPKFIQSIFIKDFDHFHDRSRKIDERLDPLRAYNLVNLTGQKWKLLRQKLTPAFSSGKLKQMFPQFNECGKELLVYLKQLVAEDKPVDVGDAMVKFTTDVIGTCAFGLQFNSLQDSNSKFRQISRDLLNFSFGANIRIVLEAFHDKLPSLLNIRTFRKEYNDFFLHFVKDTIKYRQENNIERNDFIQILMNLIKQDMAMIEEDRKSQQSTGSDQCYVKDKSDNHILLDDQMLAANTFVFFIAGFETTASTLRMCLFELSLSHNKDIQNKLRKEVVETIRNHNGEITDDTIKDMPYMECVVAETLRKYPVAGILVRSCTKPYSVPGTSITLRKGDKILVSPYSIHYDPKYFPEPDLFDPERFNEENKRNRPNYTYLPFGEGPRTCIGSRFALLEIKAALAKIISHFEIILNEKTELPLKWNPRRLILTTVQQIFLDFKPIKLSCE